MATVTTDFSEIAAGDGPGRTEESFRSGGNGGVSRCSNLGWTAKGRADGASCGGGETGLGSSTGVCDGGGCGLSPTGGSGGCRVGGVSAIAIGPGGGGSSMIGETDADGGSGVGGVVTCGGGAGVSSTGMGGDVSFGGVGQKLFTAGGANEAGFGARILVRNSVKEACFAAVGGEGSVSSEIGSSHLSCQRRI